MKRTPLSPQQAYYAELAKNLASPYKEYPWQFSGFGEWYRKTMRQYDYDFYYEGGPGPLVEEAQSDLNDALAKHRRPGFVPDAHFIDEENQCVHLLEIVETHDIDEVKARAFSYAAWELDEAYWETNIVLFYPRQVRTAVNGSALYLDGFAEKFSKLQSPYRRAFTALIEAA